VSHKFSRPRGLVPIDLDLGASIRGSIFLVCAKSALDVPRVRLVAELLVTHMKTIRAC
jgi:hypothetical protein